MTPIYIGVAPSRDILGIALETQCEVNSSHTLLTTCICSISSSRPPRCSLESSKNKRLHSPVFLEVKSMKGSTKKRGRDVKMKSSLQHISISSCLSRCFLHCYIMLGPRGLLKTPPCRQTDAVFSFYFPLHCILLLHCFLSNHLVSYAAVRCC